MTQSIQPNNSTSAVAQNAQNILNKIFSTFEIPHVDRTNAQTIKFGAFESKENCVQISQRKAQLSLSLRYPERILGRELWDIPAQPHRDNLTDKELFEAIWTQKIQEMTDCLSLSVTGYDAENSHVKVHFKLEDFDVDMQMALEKILPMTHLALKSENELKITLH